MSTAVNILCSRRLGNGHVVCCSPAGVIGAFEVVFCFNAVMFSNNKQGYISL
jgi:hypothetical protein